MSTCMLFKKEWNWEKRYFSFIVMTDRYQSFIYATTAYTVAVHFITKSNQKTTKYLS